MDAVTERRRLRDNLHQNPMQDDWLTCGAQLLDSLWARQVNERAKDPAAMVVSGQDA
jgi:hypothetical protein